jgi:hypothetical protein
MIIDCHYHLERRLLSDDFLLRKMDECEVDKVALMGVINKGKGVVSSFLIRANKGKGVKGKGVVSSFLTD